MKEYSLEEKKEMIDRINKMQREIFKFKKSNGREPNNDELVKLLNGSLSRIVEVKKFLSDLEKEDEKLELKQKKHTKDDIKKARELRKNKKEVRDIKKYMMDE